MGTYDRQAATALRLLTAKGAALTITRLVPAAPATSDRPATGPLKIVAACFGAVFPLDLGLQALRLAADSYHDQSLIRQSQRLAFVAGTGMTLTVTGGSFSGDFSPLAGDMLVAAGGVLYTVVGNDPLAPDVGTPILHAVFLRT